MNFIEDLTTLAVAALNAARAHMLGVALLIAPAVLVAGVHALDHSMAAAQAAQTAQFDRLDTATTLQLP